jgi:hypothetical protein
MKYCECGCGELAPIAKHTVNKHGIKKGQPLRFVSGHNGKIKHPPNWKGGRVNLVRKYKAIWVPGLNKYVKEHILLAEKVLNKPLPIKAEIHHFNLNSFDNSHGNIVVCQNREYHMLLHIRTRALQACGNVHWRKCTICHYYDDPKNMALRDRGRVYKHRDCEAELARERRAAKKKYSKARCVPGRRPGALR